MTRALEEVIAPHQVWLVQTTYVRAGEHRTLERYLILLAEAHPDWKDRQGLQRSHARYGRLSRHSREQALKNLEYLRTHEMLKSDWSPSLFRLDNNRLHYLEMLGVI